MMLAECLAPYLMSSINAIILFNINTLQRQILVETLRSPLAQFFTSATSTTLESFRQNTEIMADFSKRNFRICAYLNGTKTNTQVFQNTSWQ